MRLLAPSPIEDIRLRDQQTIDNAANHIPDFDPKNLEDGRKKALQHVAIRQGQAKFREKLLDAYEGCCAVTGTSIAATLQAAHIVPFRGPDTNAVQNGILL
jgi:putative restriction endonuclease